MRASVPQTRNINVISFQSLRKLSLEQVSICLAHLNSCKLPKLQDLHIFDCIVDLSISKNKQAKQQIRTMFTRLTSMVFSCNRLNHPTIETWGRNKLLSLSLHAFLSVIFEGNYLQYSKMKMKTMEFDLDNEMIKGSNHVNVENTSCGLSFSNLRNLTIHVYLHNVNDDNKDWLRNTSTNILLSSTTASNNCNNESSLMNENIDKMDNGGTANLLKLESFSLTIIQVKTIDDLEFAHNSMFRLVELDSLKRLCIEHDGGSNTFDQFCKMMQFYNTFMENHYIERKTCQLNLNLHFRQPDNIDGNATDENIQTICQIVINWWYKVPLNAQMQVQFSTNEQRIATLMKTHLTKLLANDADDTLIISKVKDPQADVNIPKRACVHIICNDKGWYAFACNVKLV